MPSPVSQSASRASHPPTMNAHPSPNLSRLNRRWQPVLMSFFLRRVRSHAEAEGLTQEATDGGVLPADPTEHRCLNRSLPPTILQSSWVKGTFAGCKQPRSSA